MVILGAGLAGLSAAYHGGGNIYEKEKEIGGTCRSLKTGGYIFDFGIHVLHTQNKYVLGLLKRNPGLRNKKRSAWIYSHSVFTKYPFQANTFGLPKYIIVECLLGFVGVLNKPKGNYYNYEDWVYANFGQGIADNFYLPYSDKFWTVNAKDLTTDWIDVRVPKPDLAQVIEGAISVQKEEFGPNAIFRYPQRGGIQRLTEGLLKKESRIFLVKEAVNINIDTKTVSFKDKTSVNYKNLISTIPLPELVRIINKVPNAVMRAAKELNYNSVLCVNLGINRKNISSAHWIYFPEEKYAPFRISFPENFSPFTVPKGHSSIQAEISYSKFKPLGHRDIVEKVIRDLRKAKIIKPKDNAKLINTKAIEYAYVIYDHQRQQNLKTINKFLRKHDIYNSGRYGSWEYQWMDDAVLDGKRAAAEAKNLIKSKKIYA